MLPRLLTFELGEQKWAGLGAGASGDDFRFGVFIFNNKIIIIITKMLF